MTGIPYLDQLINRFLKSPAEERRAYRRWESSGYPSPAPKSVKHAVIRRHAIRGSIFVESGTYFGETAEFASQFLPQVVTIEPFQELYEQATERFSGTKEVQVVHGTSEVVLPGVLSALKGASVTFWLDGHWSGGGTFQGENDTPIRQELAAIENADSLGDFVILIDDVRCFNPIDPEYKQYPPLDYLVEWARNHSKNWTIEHDIFIIK